MHSNSTDHSFVIQEKKGLVLKSCCQGVVHLSLGPATVRIEEQVFHEMVAEMGKFSQNLKDWREKQQAQSAQSAQSAQPAEQAQGEKKKAQGGLRFQLLKYV